MFKIVCKELHKLNKRLLSPYKDIHQFSAKKNSKKLTKKRSKKMKLVKPEYKTNYKEFWRNQRQKSNLLKVSSDRIALTKLTEKEEKELEEYLKNV